jgi:Kef-type K+ transport system membrane component KefB
MIGPTTAAPVARRATIRRRAFVVVGATAAAAAVWLAARAAGTDFRVSLGAQPAMTIGLPLVLVTAFAVSLAGWAALAVLERWARRGRIWWRGLASAVLLASFGPVLSAQTDDGTRLALALMHVAVAAVLIPVLPRLLARRKADGS